MSIVVGRRGYGVDWTLLLELAEFAVLIFRKSRRKEKKWLIFEDGKCFSCRSCICWNYNSTSNLQMESIRVSETIKTPRCSPVHQQLFSISKMVRSSHKCGVSPLAPLGRSWCEMQRVHDSETHSTLAHVHWHMSTSRIYEVSQKGKVRRDRVIEKDTMSW